jgi:hypothetical protein
MAGVDDDIIAAKAVDHVDEPPSAPDRAIAAGALSGLKDVEWTNHTDGEDLEVIE